MGEVSPIDVDHLTGDALARASLKASLDVHNCLDEFRAEQAERDAAAEAKRAALASEMGKLSRRVGRLALQRRKDKEAQAALLLMAKMAGAADWEPGERRRKPRSARSWLRDLGMALFGACSLIGSGIVVGLGVLENVPGVADLLRHGLRLLVTK